MSDFSQISFVDEFADNPEPRCPCVLLLDTSMSMDGRPLQELNQGITQLKQELSSDSLASKRVEIAIVTFGPVRVATAFVTADDFVPPILEATGDTPMGAAIVEAIGMVERRKAEYKQNGVSYYRPWLFLITDGGPTDEVTKAKQLVQAGEERGSFSFFGIGVEGANMQALGHICVRQPLKLSGLNFRELFSWLSTSLRSVSASKPGDRVSLPPAGWASV